MEETRKWGVTILVAIAVVAILYGGFSTARAQKYAKLLKDEVQKRITVEGKNRQLQATLEQMNKKWASLSKTNKALANENKRLKEALARANKKILYLENEMEKLKRLKETLEENLKNALMVLPEDKKQEIAINPGQKKVSTQK